MATISLYENNLRNVTKINLDHVIELSVSDVVCQKTQSSYQFSATMIICTVKADYKITVEEVSNTHCISEFRDKLLNATSIVYKTLYKY